MTPSPHAAHCRRHYYRSTRPSSTRISDTSFNTRSTKVHTQKASDTGSPPRVLLVRLSTHLVQSPPSLVISNSPHCALRALLTEHQRDAFYITDLGRIAAKFYIRMLTIEIFNEFFKPKMSEADVLHMVCKSVEVTFVYSLYISTASITVTSVRANSVA